MIALAKTSANPVNDSASSESNESSEEVTTPGAVAKPVEYIETTLAVSSSTHSPSITTIRDNTSESKNSSEESVVHEIPDTPTVGAASTNAGGEVFEDSKESVEKL